MSEAWPTKLTVNAERTVLSIAYDDGQTFELTAEYLRTHSPSAEVQGHSAAERVTVFGKKNITIRDILFTGNYAARIIFGDGHETGIFTWAYLRELGETRAENWEAYLAELAEKGLER